MNDSDITDGSDSYTGCLAILLVGAGFGFILGGFAVPFLLPIGLLLLLLAFLSTR